MSDIEILNQLIKDSAKVQLNLTNGKNQLKLEDLQSNTSIAISGVPDDTVVIKADIFRSPDSIFNGTKGECKRADFIVVADDGKKKVIICIEMKACRDSEKEIIQQLMGARCFINYCKEIGKEFWNQKNFLDGYAYRFVSINHISIPKNKTRIDRNSELHDRPDRMLKISSPHRLEFNHLAGKG
ncbi:hypothetical protein [Nitrosomonas nitrosa]|uniref:Uncharacterized protein n=1 Tax=Nitrosomonas nitrosa TaxID=52442 RepID=A0A1I4U7H4_9PROT|nr:hypothetical protein [Nitrosomonas nitrosa]MCO6433798.1 hypothetical protein [Nitrosomonas nitrosa]SFM84928.1 hypothetical protein SAMN05421880_1402 [Nitrosomonas nitrosa]